MKKFLYLVSLICALFYVGGCRTTNLYEYRSVSPDKHINYYKAIPIYVDKDFSYQQQVAIRSAIVEWNHVLNRYITLDVIDWTFDYSSEYGKRVLEKIKIEDEGIVIWSVNHDSPILEQMHQEEETLAFVDNFGNKAHNLVVVADKLGRKDLHQIMLHEIGHSLGAQHVISESAMFPYTATYLSLNCIDKITAAQIATYNHLKLEHLNYCPIPDFE